MTLKELIQRAENYEFTPGQLEKDREGRARFLATWPLDRIKNMQVHEYHTSGNKDSFLHWVEFKDILAGAGGGSSLKHGIYHAATGDYVLAVGKEKKILTANDLRKEFEKLKLSILECIELARAGRIEFIRSVEKPYSHMILLKLLTIYVPELFITVLSNSVLREIAVDIECFDVETSKEKNCIELNFAIFEKLRTIPKFKNWNGEQLGNFLWNQYKAEEEEKVEIGRELTLVGLYLAKHGDQFESRFAEVTKKELYELFYEKLGAGRRLKSFRNTLKNVRDTFDGHFPSSGREGWKNQDGSPKKLTGLNKEVFDEFSGKSEGDLWRIIEKYISSPTQELPSKSVPSRTPLNLILYGPPGTGKTYTTVYRALEVIDGHSFNDETDEVSRRTNCLARFEELRRSGRVGLVTFHQSYSYEDFIEGIRPDLNEEKGELQFQRRDGVFKAFVENMGQNETSIAFADVSPHATIWRLSLKSSAKPEVYEDCLKDAVIGVNYLADTDFSKVDIDSFFAGRSDEAGRGPLNLFINEMEKGDLVCVFNNATSIKAIGVVTGEYQFKGKAGAFPHQRTVKWLDTEVRDILELNGNKRMMTPAIHRLRSISPAALLALTNKAAPANSSGNYVFIIDEINRGNISRIFGELVTLLESDKRQGNGGVPTRLPYSGKDFILPPNLYIIGTMNSSDRSIAMIDIALRRRFQFEEMAPDSSLVVESIAGINVRKIFSELNQKIALLRGRDYQIGHSYFLKENIKGVRDLKITWFNCLMPLIAEYFHEEWDKLKALISPFIIEGKRVNGLGEIMLRETTSHEFVSSKISDEEFLAALAQLAGEKADEEETFEADEKAA